jgi:hypothetical protein
VRTKLFVRERNGDVVGELSDFTQFDMIIRRRDVGSWSVQVPIEEPLADVLITPSTGIVVERDGEVILSGPMAEVNRFWSDQTDHYIITGLSDDVVLFDRLVFPHPTDFGAAAYDVFTGKAEAAMRHYVQLNAINRTQAGVPSIALAPGDQGRGVSVTGRGRFQVLGELLQSLAISGGEMNFSVVDMTFDVSMPVDRTGDAVFSVESGNLVEFSYSKKAPKATNMIVGGGGELTDRKFLLGFNAVENDRWGRRIEVFRDRRDTVDTQEMLQTLQEELSSQAEENAVSLRPIDVPGREYGTDYEVNDLVTVEGIEARIAEVRITLDENGETISPSVASSSTVAAQSILRSFDAIRTLQRQVRDLQRML